MDYKETLNLPHTAFPMKANLPLREPEYLSRWEQEGLYEKIRALRLGAPSFILLDGPPYANGPLHLGHAVNKILKDMVVKYKTLSGFDAPFVPGWDCHGLPIEINVEKTLGKGSKMAGQDFRQACRAYAQTQIEGQRAGFKRLGVLADWHHPYTTMDPRVEADIVRSLGECYAKGDLMAGVKPVYWCLECRSALAEAEVEYKEKVSESIDVAFPCCDPAAVIALFDGVNAAAWAHTSPPAVDCIIWTTTPWTLSANQAVSLHPTAVYVLCRVNKEGRAQERLLIVAQERVEALEQRWSCSLEIIGQALGSALEGQRCAHPFLDRDLPLITGTHVVMDTGTGCVHTAPGFGVDDFAMAQQYDLPVSVPISGQGLHDDSCPALAGVHVWKLNAPVIACLQERHRLIFQESITHSYPHCWRHRTPLIFRASPHWFMAVNRPAIQEAAVRAIEQEVEWIPAWGQKRIANMVQNRPEWCLSRNRSWGTPLPFVRHKETAAVHPEMGRIFEQVACGIEKEGIDYWFNTPLSVFIHDPVEEALYEKSSEILDVWFDAGSMYRSVQKIHPVLSSPADLYLEGSDQHRGWFQASLLHSIALTGKAPYKAVLTHGYTVDAHGHKMSKSLGNGISPEEVVRSVGADVLRLWVAATDYQGELSYSTEGIQRMTDMYRRIRNTLRFLLANIADFVPQNNAVAPEELLALDAWLIAALADLHQEIMQAYGRYQFHVLVQLIQNFCTNTLGGFYLDIIKDRQYTLPVDHLARRSAQTALWVAARALTAWIAPILSFTAEEVWGYLPVLPERADASSVFLSSFQEIEELFLQYRCNKWAQMDRAFWARIMVIRAQVQKVLETARMDKKIGSGLEAHIRLTAPGSLLKECVALGTELRFVLITAGVECIEDAQLSEMHIALEVSEACKCARCWHYHASVGQSVEHPLICERCETNLFGAGEQRCYA